jgi:hypothetical protein
MANYSAKGRPEVPDNEKLSQIVQFRMTAEERQRCEAAAEKAGQKFSAWIRDRLLRAAKRKG